MMRPAFLILLVLFWGENRCVLAEPPTSQDIYRLMRLSTELRALDNPLAVTGPQLPNYTTAVVPNIETETTRSHQTMTIQQAVTMALSANLDIEIERIEPALARADILTNQGAFDPVARLTGQYGEYAQARLASQIAADGRSSVDSRNYDVDGSVEFRAAPGTTITPRLSTYNSMDTYNNFNDQFANSAGVDVRQPLLKNFGSDINLANIRIAQKGEAIAINNFQAQVENIIRNVYYAYYELLYAQANYEARLKTLQLAEQLAEDNAIRLRIGTISPLELSQARTEAATRRSELIEAEGVVRTNENDLKRLLTRSISEWLDTRISPADELMLPGVIPPREVQIESGLAHREDYRAQLKQAEQQDIRIAYSKNQLLPEIDLFTSYYRNGLDKSFAKSSKNIFQRDDDEWLVGLTLEIPLGTRTERGNLDRAKLEKSRILLQTKRLEQQIIADINNASLDLATTTRRVSSTRQAREFAQETLRAEEDRLKAGASTTYNVLQAQRDLANAQSQELRALADYNKAVVNIRHTQGVLIASSGIEIKKP